LDGKWDRGGAGEEQPEEEEEGEEEEEEERGAIESALACTRARAACRRAIVVND
jgi:hypothetical protein